MIKTHSTEYSTTVSGGSGWTLSSKSYTENPYTNDPWTWDEIDDLQAGINIQTSEVEGYGYCTQVYVVVNYSDIPAGAIANNTWYHAAGVRSAADAWELFLDGTSTANDTENVGTTTVNKLYLGVQESTSKGYYFNGDIDEVRISDIARSAAWIKATNSNLFDDLIRFNVSYIVHLDQIDEITYNILDSSNKTSRIRYLYDGYNNVTTEYLDGDITSDSDNATIHRVFYPNIEDNILNKVAEERIYSTTKTTDNSSDNLTSQTIYYYDENNASANTTPTKGNLTRLERYTDNVTSISYYFSYDEYGNTENVTDPSGNVTSWTYLSGGVYPETKTLPNDLSENYTYDPGTNNLLGLVDINGSTSNWTYDTFKRLVSVIRPGDTLTSPSSNNTYNNSDNITQQNIKTETKITSGNYTWQEQYFDGFGRVVQTHSPGTENHTIITTSPTWNDVDTTVTLRPNAAGDATQNTANPSVPNWQNVDEEAVDYYSSYVCTEEDIGWYKDLYNLTDPDLSGMISNVTIYATWTNVDSYPDAKILVKTHATEYSTTVSGSSGWTLSSKSYTDNPYTNDPWTWDEIDDLQAGINIQTSEVDGYGYCSQVYVVVNYSLPIQKMYVPQDMLGANGYEAPEASWRYSLYEYDGLGRVVTQTNADNTTINHDYSTVWSDNVTNQLGNKTRYHYDAFGRMAKVEQQDGDDAVYSTANYTYDTLGNLIQVENNSLRRLV
ncbi:LamG-like jellyroll fold domain-containing protein [Chloroflexota bacterium]